MKNYYRVMLGSNSEQATTCLEENFIGTDYGIHQDLTGNLPDEWKEFNRKFIPVFLSNRPEKSKIAAGLACGAIWTVSKGILSGDVVLCPDGQGNYLVGEVTGDYFYQEGKILQHRRPVRWFEKTINREDMSEILKGSAGSPGTVHSISRYREEIENLIEGIPGSQIIALDKTIQDPLAFAMEIHLEDFLVKNWNQTDLAINYEIYEEDGEYVGQQYPTDTGPLDILAISKDKKELLVIELKKGRASDAVVGQILRYMGYVREELAEKDQSVKGIIIAMEEDPRIQRALVMIPEIEFYRYSVSFKLIKEQHE